jgi:hypothetical protein
MALLTGSLYVRKWGDHPLVCGSFVSGLLIPAMADVTKITEGMRLMPAGPICVDRLLSLRFMTVFTGRSL